MSVVKAMRKSWNFSWMITRNSKAEVIRRVASELRHKTIKFLPAVVVEAHQRPPPKLGPRIRDGQRFETSSLDPSAQTSEAVLGGRF